MTEEELQNATAMVQAVATVRKLAVERAPPAMQIHAVATLAKRCARYTCGSTDHIERLMVLLLGMAEASDELQKGSSIPDSVQELEDRFKRLDGEVGSGGD